MIINKTKTVLILIALSLGLGISTNAVINNAPKTSLPASKAAADVSAVTYIDANSLDIVANPSKYLNKHVRVKATFDKFSTLGLDYKPAYRSSEDYISLLIKRDDVITHTIPLSEMKIFMKRDEAEKYIDLNSGDKIEFCGRVFSNALSDIWIDVEKFKVISAKPKEDTKTAK